MGTFPADLLLGDTNPSVPTKPSSGRSGTAPTLISDPAEAAQLLDSRRGGRPPSEGTRIIVASPNAYNNAAEIQAALDDDGIAFLGEGTIDIADVIEIGFNQSLVGLGSSSKLNWVGAGNYAIKFGIEGQAFYDAFARDFELLNGGIRVRNMGPSTSIDRVAVYLAPEYGIYLDGADGQYIGEKATFNNCTVNDCTTAGIGIRIGNVLTGATFYACNINDNKGYGVFIETTVENANIEDVTFRDCTIQINGNDGNTDAEVYIRGFVVGTLFDRAYIERNNRATYYGIKCSPIMFGQQRRVSRLKIDNLTRINYYPRAIDFDQATLCIIDSLVIQDPSGGDTSLPLAQQGQPARVYWKTYIPTGDFEAFDSGTDLVEYT